ncbi:uncharacterized protein ColSpa_09575 [Colletotrichum spaethianum]|uniref:Uncharacterized protein n=1 Tax=Colletotrichum spaethianum TaxID=700344 RepID=A0AA37UJA9_9PEZI|nr:uncharacterized protein ColSpa_09575 [Colletotrichum spaethianum]GKT49394.1 hypothetical protein ColSpa_09575 [Colletotrichum spaethianum]
MVSWVIFGFCRWHASSNGDVAAPSDGDLEREIKVFQRGRDTALCQLGVEVVWDDNREVREAGEETVVMTSRVVRWQAESGFTVVWGIES